MKEEEKIREIVSVSYAKAVSEPSGGGCCSGTTQKGVVAKLAGYAGDELDTIPTDAVANSFGCGNPVAFSEVREGDVVVDLGSGAGIDILLAAKKVGPSGRVIGIDMTDEMIAKARENIEASGLTNIEVRKGLIEDLPVESSSVDWVISNCVINLSPEKSKVFAEIARVLKPGGKMLVSDIVVEDLPDWVRRSEALYCSCVAGAISEGEYIGGLKKAGLDNVEVLDRLVYDVSQVSAFVKSEVIPGLEDATGCCGDPVSEDNLKQIASSMDGKVWSAKFRAQKPVG